MPDGAISRSLYRSGALQHPVIYVHTNSSSLPAKFVEELCFIPCSLPAQEAHLLAAKERNSLYYIDYELLRPGEDTKRIFQTAVSLGFNGT